MAKVGKAEKATGNERGGKGKGGVSSGDAKARSRKKDESKNAGKLQFSIPEVFSKPSQQSILFGGFREAEIDAEVVRLRIQTESVEHGHGKAMVRNFTFRKFKEEPKAVLYLTTPRGINGGSFEPTDRLLKPGEQIQISYTMNVVGADRPVYFSGKGYFLRKSFYVADNPANPGKPWAGPREEAVEKLPKDVVVAGDDIIEIRVDSITSFPNGPGSLRRDVLDRYLSEAVLYILPGGGPWNQKSAQGNFFDGVQQPLEKVLEKEDIKVIESVRIDEFENLGALSVVVRERLLADVDHEIARPSVINEPNDHIREINAALGFLLCFKMDYEIKERMMRVVSNKVGGDDEIYLPLILRRVNDAKESFRVTFRLFPRDLIVERGQNRSNQGMKFVPPYALYPGAENHNAYSKLLITLSQRFREDEKPEEDKLKSEKLVASVQSRINAQKDKFTDEKLKAAFQKRSEARKRREEGG
mgnify:CR=1 FL=1